MRHTFQYNVSIYKIKCMGTVNGLSHSPAALKATIKVSTYLSVMMKFFSLLRIITETFCEFIIMLHDSVMAQAFIFRLLNAKARVRAAAKPCGICGGIRGAGTRFSPISLASSFQYRSTLALHTYLSPGG